jgi:hypothetical protein
MLATFESCSQRSLFGTYVKHNSYGTEKVSLDSNSRFEYSNREGLLGQTSRGTWRHEGNILYLKSDKEMTSINGSVTENFTPNSNGNTFVFLGVNCEGPEKNVEVEFNDSVKIKCDNSGNIKVAFHVRSIFIRIVTTYEFYYEIEDEKANNFKVCLMPARNSELFFANRKYTLKGKYLIGSNNSKLKKEIK